MDGLRHFKEELQRVYGRNDYWLVPAFRSVFSMLLFLLLYSYNKFIYISICLGL